ncbi:MAG: T9SS type A sorting domain-containing protein [Bacteroidetes bacterium]|nr:T9SS type A sorting domain-containing protein [Bacteroidota bacterium]
MKTKKVLMLGMWLTFSFPLFSQWVNDPDQNTLIGGGSQLECPMITTDQAGNSYVSFWEQMNGFYNLHLQKVDVNGYPLWGADGIVISDEDTVQTFTTVYDIGLDRENNAILFLEDSRMGDADVYAYKVDPNGNMLWGPDGIKLSQGPSFDLFPNLMVMEDNSVVFAWQTEDSAGIFMQRISALGNKLWGPDGILYYHSPADSMPYLSYPKVVNCDGSSFFLIYEKSDAPVFSASQSLCIRRFDMAGQALWSGEVIFQNIGQLPVILRLQGISDQQQGCIISWLDGRNNPLKLEGYIQRIDLDGNALYQQNGLCIFIPGLYGYNDIASVVDYQGNIYSFLNTDTLLMGQKMSPTGQLLWNNQGILFDSIINNPNVHFAQLEAIRTGSYNLVKFALDSMISSTIRALMTDESGNLVWPSHSIPVASCNSTKIFSCSSGYHANQVVVAWQDDRNAGFSNIYAQNIFPDGNIGPLAVNKVKENSIRIYPNPASDLIKLNPGEMGETPVEVELYQSSGQKVFIGTFSENAPITLDVSKLERGVYYLVLKTKERTAAEKVVIL